LAGKSVDYGGFFAIQDDNVLPTSHRHHLKIANTLALGQFTIDEHAGSWLKTVVLFNYR